MAASIEERVPEVIRNLLSSPFTVPVQIPRSPGFYAWWRRRDNLADTSPPIPYQERSPTSSEWSPVYVGISPSTPSSTRDVAARIATNHVGGNVGNSTFRLTLAALLMERL